MIQARSQFNNVYVKVLEMGDAFAYTLDKIRMVPNRGFNMETGEWIMDRKDIGHLLASFSSQISWMTPLSEIVQGIPLDNDLVKRHLGWEREKDFPNFKLELYPYQKVGAGFLVDRGCAAVFDGCGLGKTPEIIGACEKIFERLNHSGRGLIVTLNGIKRQWAREVEKFTGKTAIAVVGTAARRKKLIKEFAQRDDLQYMVINYETLRDREMLNLIKSIRFDVVALDEAQKIKTGVTDTFLGIEPSQVASATHELMYIPHRFVATATPVQGKVEEIWSIMHFINPDILGPWERVREHFCTYSKKYGITGYQNQGELYWRIAPYFIRRTKDMPEIQQQLPQVQHSHIFLDMVDKQEVLHDYLVEKLSEVKEQARGVSGYTFIAGKSMSPEEAKDYFDALSQGYQQFLLGVCDSPQLITMSDSNMAKMILKDIPLTEKDFKSPKIDFIRDFYNQMLYDEPKSKIVIFTKFERMAELIHRALNTKSNGKPIDTPQAVIYHGQMSDNAREWNKNEFVGNPDIKAIVSTDAGSTGLNLQVANYMIHVDLPWDPTMIEQRNGRIDRTGNAFANVTIYYLMMSGSYDEHLLGILERKQELANQILAGGSTSKARSQNVSKLAMDSLIRNREKKNKKAATGG